jgi:hypothetical protein
MLYNTQSLDPIVFALSSDCFAVFCCGLPGPGVERLAP